MEALYHKTRNSINIALDKLKNLELSLTQEEVNAHSAQLNQQLDEMLSNFDRLDIYVNKEPVSRRTEAKIKVDELKYDLKHIQASFRSTKYKK
jgi:Golgi SNAP receptor complex protein 2